MNCDGLEVPAPALGGPPRPCCTGDSLGVLVLAQWNVCARLTHERKARNICLSSSGCLQELNPTTSSCFGEPGNAEFKVKG